MTYRDFVLIVFYILLIKWEKLIPDIEDSFSYN